MAVMRLNGPLTTQNVAARGKAARLNVKSKTFSRELARYADVCLRSPPLRWFSEDRSDGLMRRRVGGPHRGVASAA